MGTGILQPPYRTEVRSGERSVLQEGGEKWVQQWLPCSVVAEIPY
jgi:hypothetical protein